MEAFLEHYRQIYLKLLTTTAQKIIVNQQAYGFNIDTLKRIHDYFSKQKNKKRVKVNAAYSSCKDIFYWVLCYFIYNFIILFYFFEELDIASHADDNKFYTVNETKESVIGVLETSSSRFSCSLDGFITTL